MVSIWEASDDNQLVSGVAMIFGCCPMHHVKLEVPERPEPMMKIGRGIICGCCHRMRRQERRGIFGQQAQTEAHHRFNPPLVLLAFETSGPYVLDSQGRNRQGIERT
jgi:hypothetical protein